jgi:hypothetical protein
VKWVFLLGLLVFTPWLIAHLKANPAHLPRACFAIGILPFLLSGFNLTASPISWASWPGPVKGFDISLIDSIALAVFLSSRRISTPVAIKVSFTIYAIAVLISTLRSEVMMGSSFYDWQLARAVLVYMAIARACVTEKGVPIAVVSGIGSGLIIQAIVSLNQYLGGEAQAGGWFGHQNLLGMASHFGTFPAAALLLAGFYPKRAFAVVAAGLLVSFTGASRATIGLFALGLLMTWILSVYARSNGRKMAIGFGMMVALLVAAPVLWSAVERRTDTQRDASNEMRSQMVRAATMIITDYPMGVGPNYYVVVANTGGYAARAGIAWNPTNREAPVHNSFYLVTAEMGWLGLLGLISFLGSIIAVALSSLRKASKGLEGELLVGVTASLIIFTVHAYFEWITMYFHIHYLLAINVGLLIGLRQIATAKKRPARRISAPSAELARSGA